MLRIYIISVIGERMNTDHHWKYATRENQSTWKKACLNATLFTTSTIWTGLGYQASAVKV